MNKRKQERREEFPHTQQQLHTKPRQQQKNRIPINQPHQTAATINEIIDLTSNPLTAHGQQHQLVPKTGTKLHLPTFLQLTTSTTIAPTSLPT